MAARQREPGVLGHRHEGVVAKQDAQAGLRLGLDDVVPLNGRLDGQRDRLGLLLTGDIRIPLEGGDGAHRAAGHVPSLRRDRQEDGAQDGQCAGEQKRRHQKLPVSVREKTLRS